MASFLVFPKEIFSITNNVGKFLEMPHTNFSSHILILFCIHSHCTDKENLLKIKNLLSCRLFPSFSWPLCGLIQRLFCEEELDVRHTKGFNR